MGVIKKQYFGVTSEMIKYLLGLWDAERMREVLMRRREIYCLNYVVFIGFYGGLRGEEVFLTSLKGGLKLWEEKRNNKEFPHVVVTLKGRFKKETGEKGCMLPLADTTGSGIEVRKWVGRLLELLVEEYRQLEGYVFQ